MTYFNTLLGPFPPETDQPARPEFEHFARHSLANPGVGGSVTHEASTFVQIHHHDAIGCKRLELIRWRAIHHRRGKHHTVSARDSPVQFGRTALATRIARQTLCGSALGALLETQLRLLKSLCKSGNGHGSLLVMTRGK